MLGSTRVSSMQFRGSWHGAVKSKLVPCQHPTSSPQCQERKDRRFCHLGLAAPAPVRRLQERTLGEIKREKPLEKWDFKGCPLTPVPISRPQDHFGSGREREGGNPWLQPGMDYWSKLKAAVCSLLHQRSGKNFQLRLPGGKAKNLHLNSNGFGKRRKQTKTPTTTTGA